MAVRGYPKALEAWVLRSLERERERRFESVGEMLDDLLDVFPGYASEGELAALLRRLCGDSILDERRQIRAGARTPFGAGLDAFSSPGAARHR